MASAAHLGWIPLAGAVGFAVPFVFAEIVPLPVDVYFLVYFCSVYGLLAAYVKTTGLQLRRMALRRWAPGAALGVVVGLVMVQGVFSRPGSEMLAGGALAWALLWRGLVYGAVDGLLLHAFPWVVVWRALQAEGQGLGRWLAAAMLAWVAGLAVTSAYHLGYEDFRSAKLVQPNIGAAMMSLPTLISANPLASPIAHALLHVAAVVHVPDSDLFLPPHRAQP